jgi:hypothetical protein
MTTMIVVATLLPQFNRVHPCNFLDGEIRLSWAIILKISLQAFGRAYSSPCAVSVSGLSVLLKMESANRWVIGIHLAIKRFFLFSRLIFLSLDLSL